MMPKELGKLAKASGINAPTLDRGLDDWLKNANAEEKKCIYVEWWEGWYEALDESISFQQDFFTKNRAVA